MCYSVITINVINMCGQQRVKSRFHRTEINMGRDDISVPKSLPWNCLTTLLCVCVGGVWRNCMDVHACLTLVVAHPCNKYGCSSHHSAHLLILLKYTSITSLNWHASTGQIMHCSGWTMLKSVHAGYFFMLLSSFVDFLFRINHV